jgi:hypothetical protein
MIVLRVPVLIPLESLLEDLESKSADVYVAVDVLEEVIVEEKVDPPAVTSVTWVIT